MSTGINLALKRNPAWKPNGPMDYARSARKWSIKPTAQTAFFVHQNTLVRRFGENKRHHGSGGAGTGGGSTTVPGSGTGTGTGTGTGAGAGTGTSEVPANDVQNDLEYVVPVTIGTPGVTLKLDFDTGSADLWVWSSLFKATAANLQGHTIYDPTKSSTSSVEKGLTWNISYGDGSSASGSVYTDTVTLADLAVPGQSVEAATKLSSSFLSENASDGLLGLAFPTINTVSPTQAKTPVEQMIEQNLIEQPIFTVKLDKGDSNGFYTFGYIEPSVELVAPIAYTAINSSNGFWEFESPTLKVGTTVVNRSSGNTAIADTGTTLILLDDAAVSAIYSTIPGAKLDNNAGGWTIPSTVSASSLPTLSFAVGTSFYSIAGEDLIFADNGDGTSFGSVQSRGQNPQDILGDVFLKSVYAVFDQTPGAPRIGFGQRAAATA